MPDGIRVSVNQYGYERGSVTTFVRVQERGRHDIEGLC